MSRTLIVKGLRTSVVVVAETVLRVPETAAEIEAVAGVPVVGVEGVVVAAADAVAAVVVDAMAADMVDTAAVGDGTRPFATDFHGSTMTQRAATLRRGSFCF